MVFSGIGGAGMNPLALLLLARGETVIGSDRSFDQGLNTTVRDKLLAAGAKLVVQDGSGITADLDRVVHSAAVEMTTPEMRAAQRLAIPCQPRPELLAELINAGEPGIAIAGSSGKSTITGMLAWILRQTGHEASVLGGAALAEGGAQHMGHAQISLNNRAVIAEACESDGSLVGYRPSFGVISASPVTTVKLMTCWAVPAFCCPITEITGQC